MERKSLFLLLMLALVGALMFTGCQQDVQYVPGPTVEIPGEIVEVPGQPGPGQPYPEPYPVPVNPDFTFTSGSISDLQAELLKDGNNVIVLAVPLTGGANESLEIPAGKSLWLLADLELTAGTSAVTLDVKGELMVAASGKLTVTEDSKLQVSGEVKIVKGGTLVTDVPASVTDGTSTALGTAKVVIDDPTAILEYTEPVPDLNAVKTAYTSYLTQGIIDVKGLKLSDLVTVVDSADVGKKTLVAKALVLETEAALTVPVNAGLTAADGDGLATLTGLTVYGDLAMDTAVGAGSALQALETLTIDGGTLTTKSNLPKVTAANLSLAGGIIGSEATTYFDSLTTLTIFGDTSLPGAFQTPGVGAAKLKTLIINDGVTFTADLGTFSALTSLSIGNGAVVSVPEGTFAALTSLTIGNGAVVTAPKGTFDKLKKLDVSGTLVAGTTSLSSDVFPVLTDLSVIGKGNVNISTGSSNKALETLKTLKVEKDANLSITGQTIGGTAAGSITTLDLAATSTFTGIVKWEALQTVTIGKGVELNVGTDDLTKLKTLNLEGTLTASSSKFAGITTITGEGKLTAGDVVVVGTNQAAAEKTKGFLLLNSTLSSVSLATATTANDIPKEVTLTIPAGKTRSFTGTGKILGPITVESGAVLNITAANVGTATGAGKSYPITVSGTLSFDAASAEPVAPITVNAGGHVIFAGSSAVPGADITVNSGGTLEFKGTTAAPKGDVLVNGELIVADDADVSIAVAGKKLSVNGALKATDLEAKGFTYTVPTGGSLGIAATSTGSEITVTVGTTPGDEFLDFSPGGYITDTTPKQPWSIQGGSLGGNFRYSGAVTKIITLGKGVISTDDGLDITGGSEAGVVTLEDGASIVVHGNSPHNGLLLKQVIIDLTANGKIVIEPNAKLILSATGGTALGTSPGIITTDSIGGVANTAVAGTAKYNGTLTTGSGYSTTLGTITKAGTIDKNDTFDVAAVTGIITPSSN